MPGLADPASVCSPQAAAPTVDEHELIQVPDFSFFRSGKLLQEAKITGNVIAETEITQMLFHKRNGFRPLSKGRMTPSSREPARRRFGQRKTPRSQWDAIFGAA